MSSEQSREALLAATFVSLADTLVVGYDVVDLLQQLVETCAILLGASAAGLLLADEAGTLEVVASTSQRGLALEILQLGEGLGPCVQCYETGAVVAVPDVSLVSDDWRSFRESALEYGWRSAYAVPLRLRGETLGALNLFSGRLGTPGPEDASVMQALADVATIGIVHERALRQSETTKEQLQRALDSRVVIEQAKGVIAQSRNVEMKTAFTLLRGYARSNSTELSEVARAVAERRLTI